MADDERPELLFVALASGLGGSMRSLATLMGHLDGYTRVVACPAPSGFVELIEQNGCFERRIELPDIRTRRVRSRLRATWVVAWYAWRHRRSLAAIHANGLSERNVVALAAAVVRKPLIVWAHEWTVSPWSRRLGRLLNTINPTTQLVAVSDYGRRTLAASGLAEPEEVEIVPNPIDPEEVRAPRPTSSGAGPVCTVGYLGAPAPYKGFHLLPAVIRQMDGDPVRWLIFSGPRTEMSDTWSELESLPASKVQLEEKVVDVRQAYARIDIAYCPSFEESFGRVVAEAMANGLPVVASDLPPLAELLGSDQAGLVVPPGDVDAAVSAIRRLAADPAERDRMGRAGIERAVRYEPERIALQMEGLYRRGRPARSVPSATS